MEIKLVKNKDFIYRVEQNENLITIANKFKIPESRIVFENNLTSKELKQGDLLYISCENSHIYVVKPLDTIEKIANKFNVTKEFIIKKNNLKNNNLFIGQKLIF